MSEQYSEHAGGCPTWCRNVDEPSQVHAHVSDDVRIGDHADPTVARMIQLAGSDLVRIVVGHSVVGVEEAEAFGYALLRLARGAHLAEPGLGIVEVLARQAGASINELALASGLDADRLRAQRAGGRLLDVRELDRLALAAAQLLRVGRRTPVAAAPVEADPVEAEPVEEELAGLVGIADLSELAALAGDLA